MKALITSLVLICASTPVMAAPQFECNLNYVLRDTDGSTKDFIPSESILLSVDKVTKLELKDFVLEGNIKSIRRSDGKATGGYELELTITKGTTAAHSSTVLPTFRAHARLDLDNEQAFVNCMAPMK